jgi:hypothetical protein
MQVISRKELYMIRKIVSSSIEAIYLRTNPPSKLYFAKKILRGYSASYRNDLKTNQQMRKNFKTKVNDAWNNYQEQEGDDMSAMFGKSANPVDALVKLVKFVKQISDESFNQEEIQEEEKDMSINEIQIAIHNIINQAKKYGIDDEARNSLLSLLPQNNISDVEEECDEYII